MARKWITREEIAEIYDSLGANTVRLDKAIVFTRTARDIRATEEIKPLIRENGFLVRSGRNNW